MTLRRTCRGGVGVIVLASVCVGGCNPALNNREVRRIQDTMPTASAIGGCRDLAHWLQKDLDANTTISDADKADLRARAKILVAQAASLERGLQAYDNQDPSVNKRNLEIRTAALEDEYRALVREWMVFQVRHGQRAAEDVNENVDVGKLIDAR